MAEENTTAAPEPVTPAPLAPDPAPEPAPAPEAPRTAAADPEVVIPKGTPRNREAVFVAAANAKKIRDEQMAEYAAEHGGGAPAPEAPPAPAAAEPAAPPAADGTIAAAPVAPAAPAKPTIPADDVIVIVKDADGNDREMTVAEARSQLNKGFNTLSQRARKLNEREKALAPEAEPDNIAQAPTAPTEPDWGGLAKKLQYGSEAEAGEALKTIARAMNGGQQAPEASPINKDEIVREAVATMRGQQATQDAMNIIATEFKPIIEDPHLTSIAGSNFDQIMQADKQAGRVRHPTEVAREAGQRTLDWLNGRAPGRTANPAPSPAPSPPAPALNARTDAKRNLSQPPARAAARAPSNEAARPKSNSEVIADKRRARGQAEF